MKLLSTLISIVVSASAAGATAEQAADQAECAPKRTESECKNTVTPSGPGCYWCDVGAAALDNSQGTPTGEANGISGRVGGHCMALPPPGEPPATGADHECDNYRRVLSDFNERHLFALMEGEELEYHLLNYEVKKGKNTSLGLCQNEGSLIHGQISTHSACFGPNHQDSIPEKEQSAAAADDYTPWIVPSTKASLLAKNPGIWSIEDFLNEDEASTLAELINKYGYDNQFFGPCKNAERQPSNAHPADGKICFKISPENVCEGPYYISDCSTKTAEEDSKFIASILSKFKQMWSTNVDPLPYIKFQVSLGGTPPMDLHLDNYSISLVLYLTDGGAAMTFPNAGVTIEPKKGAAYTWLNTFKDGSSNPLADHAVQAHPKETGERGVMLLSFTAPPVDILAATE